MHESDPLNEHLDQIRAQAAAQLIARARDSECIFALVSAYREEQSPDQNERHSLDLKKALRESDFGFYEIAGHWTDTTVNTHKVVTSSKLYFLSATLGPDQSRFQLFTLSLMNLFEQHTALLRLDENLIQLIDSKGHTQATYAIETAEDIQSLCSPLQPGKTFAVGYVHPPDSFTTRLVKRELEKE